MALIYQKDNLIITDDFILKLGEREIPVTDIGRVEIVDFPHLKYWLWVLVVIGILILTTYYIHWMFSLLLFLVVFGSFGEYNESTKKFPILKLFSKSSGRIIAEWENRINAEEEKEIIEGLTK